LLDNINFYHHHHVRKVCIHGQTGLFRHIFKEKRSKEMEQAKRLYKTPSEMQKLPYLQKFQLGCKLRISKLVKNSGRFAVLTFKRNMLTNQSFWEVAVDFARSHVSYVCQIAEEDMACILSDEAWKGIKMGQTLAPANGSLLSSNRLNFP
jgi:hypothetical protein